MRRVVGVLGTLLRVLTIVGLAVVTFAAPAAASQTVSIVSAGYRVGTTGVDVVLSVPGHIDSAARKQGKNYGLCVTVSYTSQDQTSETIQSGRVSVADTTAGGKLGKGNVADILTIQLGSTPAPGGSPGYQGTAVLLDPSELACP